MALGLILLGAVGLAWGAMIVAWARDMNAWEREMNAADFICMECGRQRCRPGQRLCGQSDCVEVM